MILRDVSTQAGTELVRPASSVSGRTRLDNGDDAANQYPSADTSPNGAPIPLAPLMPADELVGQIDASRLRGGSPTVLETPVRAKALIVDPDEKFLAFAAEALNSFRPGFDVATARNVEGATEWLQTIDPDLLLLGLDPTKDGAKVLAERLRKDPRREHRRILYLSGRDNGVSTAELDGCECEAVPKPTTLTNLLRLVRNCMHPKVAVPGGQQ